MGIPTRNPTATTISATAARKNQNGCGSRKIDRRCSDHIAGASRRKGHRELHPKQDQSTRPFYLIGSRNPAPIRPGAGCHWLLGSQCEWRFDVILEVQVPETLGTGG